LLGHIDRRITADQASSLTALWFGEDRTMDSWSSDLAEAVWVHDALGDVAHVFWPSSGSIGGYHGYEVTGEMGGRRLDDPAYFGRSITYLAHEGTPLLMASDPVDLFAHVEVDGPAARFAILHTTTTTDLTLYCPQAVTQVWVDGVPYDLFTWSGATLSLTLPPGDHRLDLH